jgi:3-hydroxybutyryl-CoA dehydratase
MNNYKIDEIYIGLKESFIHQISDYDIDSFTILSGDTNPLHNDTSYARKMGFDERVAHGFLSASLISRLVGVFLPGKYSIIQHTEIFFHNPVYNNDNLNISGEVKSISFSTNTIEILILITNQKSLKIITGKIRVGILNEK